MMAGNKETEVIMERAPSLFEFLQSVLVQEDSIDDVASSGLSEKDFPYAEELLRGDLHKVESEEQLLQDKLQEIHTKKAALVLEVNI